MPIWYALQTHDWLSLLLSFGVRLLALLFVIPLHEVAHGWMAMRLGDPTAKHSGRLTLNPLAHINWLGTLMMLFVGFGWAEPVPVNPLYFKHRKRDMALTALAGPVSNLLMAYIGLLLWYITNLPPISAVYATAFGTALHLVLYYWVTMNISLAVFNLIPVAPLDGSRILSAFVPDSFLYRFARYEKPLSIVLLLLVFTGRLDGVLSAVNGVVYRGLSVFAGLPFRLFGVF